MTDSRWRQRRLQAVTIARATFGGFLQSDVMPAGVQASSAIWAAAFLAAPAIFPCAQDIIKYNFLRRYHPGMVELALWGDKALFVLLSAGAMGIIAVVLWDTLFPGRRDVFVLGTLPVGREVQAAGRLGGLIALFALFAAALNAIPTMLFPIGAGSGLFSIGRTTIGHVVSVLAADAFVFFGLTALQGVLLVIAPRRVAERLAPIIQTSAVLVLLLTLLFLVPLQHATALALQRSDAADPILRWFPMAWFVGLAEAISGSPRPIMGELAVRALVAGALPLLATMALYAFAYKRLCTRAIETPARSSAWTITRYFSGAIKTLLVRQAQERAICAFTLRVFARSRRHRMLLSIYLGAALALIATALIPDIMRAQPDLFARPTVAVLATPLILSAALAVGFRVLIAIPVDLPARWIFETFSVRPLGAGGGVHKAALLVVLVPVVATAWLSAAPLWGPALAWRHALFCGVLSIFLIELLLVTDPGVPFARTYVPGGSRFHMLWPVYISCFITYTYSAASAERWMLMHGALAFPVALVAGAAAVLAAVRLWRLSQLPSLSFDTALPDAMFAGFNLSEGLAAEAVARHESAAP